MSDTILVIDEGTTSTRAMLFSPDGACLASEQTELEQHYPRAGWVEHDAGEIWRKTLRDGRAGGRPLADRRDRHHQSA